MLKQKACKTLFRVLVSVCFLVFSSLYRNGQRISNSKWYNCAVQWKDNLFCHIFLHNSCSWRSYFWLWHWSIRYLCKSLIFSYLKFWCFDVKDWYHFIYQSETTVRFAQNWQPEEELLESDFLNNLVLFRLVLC